MLFPYDDINFRHFRAFLIIFVHADVTLITPLRFACPIEYGSMEPWWGAPAQSTKSARPRSTDTRLGKLPRKCRTVKTLDWRFNLFFERLFSASWTDVQWLRIFEFWISVCDYFLDFWRMILHLYFWQFIGNLWTNFVGY